MYYELEDLFGDVVGKARRGQELSIKNTARELDIQIDSWMDLERYKCCLLYTSPSPRDRQKSRMPSSA